jgi:hypothetical protein
MSGEAAVQHVQQPDSGQVIEFGSFRHPETVLKEAELVAKTFQRRAEQLQLYKTIGPSKHLLIEGWQMLASMYRVTAGVVEDRYIEIGDARGYEATAEAIYVLTAQRISTAKAMCLSDEENWGMRNKYEWVNKVKTLVGTTPTPLQQLRSMAQTRACSKVLSNLLKWVARMGGYAGTPSEEMTGQEDTSAPGNGGGMQQPQRKSSGSGSGLISEAQEKRLWALAHQANKNKETVGVILAHYGFPDGSQTVTRDKYQDVCTEIMG